MSEPTQEQNLVIDPKAVMSGFCWSYCNALTEEFERLIQSEELWEESDGSADLSMRGFTVIKNLTTQLLGELPYETFKKYISEPEAQELLGNARNFLAIFEKK